MDDRELALLILDGASLWIEETDSGLAVYDPVDAGPWHAFWYARMCEYAADKHLEVMDVYVERDGELLWIGELLDGLGIASSLRSRMALRELAREPAEPEPWTGYCPECTRLVQKRYRMRPVGGGEWECPRCGYIAYAPSASPRVRTREERERALALILWRLECQRSGS